MGRSYFYGKIIICIYILCSFYGCNEEQKGELIQTEKLANNIYVEQFYKSSGVYGGGSEKYFVTDSSTYHIQIGECDDKEFLTFRVNDSILIVEKHSRRNLKDGASKIIDNKIYDLNKMSN